MPPYKGYPPPSEDWAAVGDFWRELRRDMEDVFARMWAERTRGILSTGGLQLNAGAVTGTIGSTASPVTLSTGLTYQVLKGGVVQNSSLGTQSVVTGLTGIRSAWAARKSTSAPSTAGGVASVSVGFSTSAGTLDICAWKPTSTANTQLGAATSTADQIAWTAFGS